MPISKKMHKILVPFFITLGDCFSSYKYEFITDEKLSIDKLANLINDKLKATKLGTKKTIIPTPVVVKEITNKVEEIKLTEAEIQSNFSRVQWAESLILQIPQKHEGRNSWLLNYGVSEEAKQIQEEWSKKWENS